MLQNSILTQKWRSPSSNTGSLIVKRDTGLMGSACAVRLFVNGIPAADLQTSEKVQFFLPAGEYVLGATATGICGGGTTGASVVIVKNRQRVYRISSGQGGDIHIQPSAF